MRIVDQRQQQPQDAGTRAAEQLLAERLMGRLIGVLQKMPQRRRLSRRQQQECLEYFAGAVFGKSSDRSLQSAHEKISQALRIVPSRAAGAAVQLFIQNLR